jgi:hypothetical protein
MKYPLSYMIYAPAIDALPADVKTLLFKNLRRVLMGEETSAKYGYLTPELRTAIVEILRDTKPEVLAP